MPAWIAPKESFSVPKEIGALEKVPVRELWADEAREFTPWLAGQAELLGEALGLDLTHEGTEVQVGRYKLDLLFRESNGQLVVVENMFGASDHDHLGKLITYMAGLEARYAVLVAEEIRPEHHSALNHLNTISGDEFGFFAIGLEAWRIGGSLPAPRLRLDVHPDNWRRSVKMSQTITPAQERYLRFWGELLEILRDTYPGWTNQNPYKDNWIALPSAASGVATYNPAFCGRKGARRVRIEVYIDTRDSATTKQVFDHLHNQQGQIEEAVGEGLDWDRLDDRRASRISLYFPGNMEIGEEKRWPEVQRWLVEMLGKVRDKFNPYLADCKTMLESGGLG